MARADVLLAEDTRISRKLLDRYGIVRKLDAYHAHNESARAPQLAARAMTEKLAIALISDAGSPLVSDPGYPLTQAFIACGLPIRAIPGPSAVIAGLISSGFAAERFAFEGFLANKAAARRKQLLALLRETRTVVLFEAPHRILAALADIEETLGPTREIAVLRELTKLHETCYRGTVAEVRAQVTADPNGERGEIVLVIAPARPSEDTDDRAQALLKLLLPHVSNRVAVDLAVELTEQPRNKLYALALALREEAGGLPDLH